MNTVLLDVCKQLIDDAKSKCADLVFKEVCLEILARAKHVLDDKEFKTLMVYASERIEEETAISIDAVV